MTTWSHIVGQASQSEANPQMITLGRQSRGLTQSELAERVSLTQGTVSKIEAGVVKASRDELTRISDALEYPPEFFSQWVPIEGPGVTEMYHRKRQKVSASVLHKVHAIAAIRRMNIEVLLRSAEDRAVNIPSLPAEQFGDPAKAARTVRAMWNVPAGPIFDMTTLLEASGAIVVVSDFETRQIDGFSRRQSRDLPPLLYMNADQPPDRWRWTLAHELAHVVLHSAVDPYPEMEDDANAFASEFLAPAFEVKPQLADLNMGKLAGLKRYWKISMQALLMRGYHLNVISDSQRRYMFMQLSKAGFRLREPVDLDPPRETPQALTELVRFFKEDLGYSESDLCTALRLSANDYQNSFGNRNLRIVA